MPDLVSTIIPVYNRGAMLREAVQSVLHQKNAGPGPARQAGFDLFACPIPEKAAKR